MVLVVETNNPDDNIEIFVKLGAKPNTYNYDFQGARALSPTYITIPTSSITADAQGNYIPFYITVYGANRYPIKTGSILYTISVEFGLFLFHWTPLQKRFFQ